LECLVQFTSGSREVSGSILRAQEGANPTCPVTKGKRKPTRTRNKAVASSVSRTDETQLLVIFFDDMKGSTALKESLAETRDEQAFQALRQEHDALLTEIVTREGGGEVLKTTGDGLLAIFFKPATAVQRALEIQERLHGHSHLSVRTGMDMGEVRIESANGVRVDAFAPVCKLLVHDPDTDVDTESQAQIFLSTAARTVRLKDGSLQTVRIPDVILRVGATGNEALMHALNSWRTNGTRSSCD